MFPGPHLKKLNFYDAFSSLVMSCTSNFFSYHTSLIPFLSLRACKNLDCQAGLCFGRYLRNNSLLTVALLSFIWMQTDLLYYMLRYRRTCCFLNIWYDKDYTNSKRTASWMAAKYKEKRETIDKINMRKEKKLLSY